jgi:hypothetical protein
LRDSLDQTFRDRNYFLLAFFFTPVNIVKSSLKLFFDKKENLGAQVLLSLINKFILQKSILLVFNGQKKNSATELDFCKVNQSFYWSKPLPSHGKKIKFWFQLVDKNIWLCFLKNIPKNFIFTMNSFFRFLFRNWNYFLFFKQKGLTWKSFWN